MNHISTSSSTGNQTLTANYPPPNFVAQPQAVNQPPITSYPPQSTPSTGNPQIQPKPQQPQQPKTQQPQQPKPQQQPQQSQQPNSNQPKKRCTCRFCKRNFAEDRIETHERICEKASKKKKKVFDARKMRIKGSEAEQFIDKMDDNTNTPSSRTKNGVLKYKIEHEKLIQSLRAARQYTDYENQKSAGKATGPPPQLPPAFPDDDDDREQCPYCRRKFAPDAAKKHIPVCERMNAKRNPRGKK